MVQLEEWRAQFEAVGLKVAGMTYDGLEILADFHADQALGYPLLSDEGGEYAIALNVLNENYKPGDFAYGVAHPGILHITSDGVVAAKLAVPGYRRRPSMEAVLEVVSADLEH